VPETSTDLGEFGAADYKRRELAAYGITGSELSQIILAPAVRVVGAQHDAASKTVSDCN
jgi:hypothetical protein